MEIHNYNGNKEFVEVKGVGEWGVDGHRMHLGEILTLNNFLECLVSGM